jgi:transposase
MSGAAVNGRITVSKKSVYQAKIIEEFVENKITRELTSKLINKSERQVSRLAKRYKKNGLLGIQHKSAGKQSNRSTDQTTVEKVRELYSKTYVNFNYSHFHEKLLEIEKIDISYATVKRILKPLNSVKRPRKVRKIRKYRNRKENTGLMLQMDGSDHEWIDGVRWCLIGGIDDATSQVPYAEFFFTESMNGYLKVLDIVFDLKGVPRALYIDHASWLSGTTKNENSGQFKRICEEFNILPIYADSAQAKGRIERLWRTFQDRLVAELSLHKIKTMQDANKFLNEIFLKKWNEEFTVVPAKTENLFQPSPAKEVRKEIFALKFERKIRNDETILWESKMYQSTANFGYSIARKIAQIRVYEDGSIKAFADGRDLEIKQIRRTSNDQQQSFQGNEQKLPGLKTQIYTDVIFKQNCSLNKGS